MNGGSEAVVRSIMVLALELKLCLSDFSSGMERQKEGYQGTNITVLNFHAFCWLIFKTLILTEFCQFSKRDWRLSVNFTQCNIWDLFWNITENCKNQRYFEYLGFMVNLLSFYTAVSVSIVPYLPQNPRGYFHVRRWGAWPQNLPLKLVSEPQILPSKI